MNYETAEAIIRCTPQHAITIALVRRVAAQAYPNPKDHEIVANLVLAALARAYADGCAHERELQ